MGSSFQAQPGGAPGGLQILEATGEGVHAYPLVSRLRGYYIAGYVKAIGIRRLQMRASEGSRQWKEKVAALRSFLKEVVGKPYSLNPKKFLPAAKTDTSSRARRGSIQQGYFCSELAAAVLKHLSAIEIDQHRSSHFWPAAFEDGGEIEAGLAKGAKLAETVLLDCRVLEVGKAQERSQYTLLDSDAADGNVGGGEISV